jgi:hypothetical protein
MSLPLPPSAQPFSVAAAYGADARWMASGQYQPPQRRVRSLRGLSMALQLMFPVLALLALATAGGLQSRAAAGDRFLDVEGSFAAIEDAELTFELFLGLLIVGALATTVVMIVWQFRHAHNAILLSGPLGLGPGWAIGGWVIASGLWLIGNATGLGRDLAVVLWTFPFLGVLLPACQLFQADRASDPALPAGAPSRGGRGSRVVVVWALVFGTGFAVVEVARVLFPWVVTGDGRWVGDAVDADRLMSAGYVVVAVAAILALGMVRALTNRQEMRVAVVLGVSQSQAFSPYYWAGGTMPLLPAAPFASAPGPGPAPAPTPLGYPMPSTPFGSAVAAPPPGAFPTRRPNRMWGAWLAAATIAVAFVVYGNDLGGQDDEFGGGRDSGTDGNDIAASLENDDLVTPVVLSQLDVGDCFDDSEPMSSGRAGEITIVDCDEPHDNEVFAIGRLTGGDDYPGEDDINAQASRKCSDEAFEAYVGRDYATSEWYIGWYSPDEIQWGSLNNRKAICVLDAEGDAPMTGSKRGSGT